MGGVINSESKDFPMMRISWHDVQAFIKKLNEFTGKKFRLPTEAEWEYAAHGGKNNEYIYSGSNDIDEVAWYSVNSFNEPHPVGLKKPNELGIYDMSGNMWEWCHDWWGFYTEEPQINPTGPSTGEYRIVRGGGFANPANSCCIVFRVGIDPHGTGIIGFRLAHD
jgi:formylglycine-generating enzyme required for sulfatase activity